MNKHRLFAAAALLLATLAPAAAEYKPARPVEFVVHQNSGQITDAASKGTWDVTFLPQDAERMTKMSFGPVYEVADATYIVKPNSQVIKADGKFIVPGLWDAHSYGTWFLNDFYVNNGVTSLGLSI